MRRLPRPLRALLRLRDIRPIARVFVVDLAVHVLLRSQGIPATARIITPRRVRARDNVATLSTRSVRTLIEWADRLAARPGARACLARSLTLYRLLNVEGVPVDLVVGVGKPGGEVSGHAWLSMRGDPLLEQTDPRLHFEQVMVIPSPTVPRSTCS